MDTRDQCQRALSILWKSKAHACDGGKCPGVLKQESGEDSYVWQDLKPAENEKTSAASSVFHCLPDTVDPRPK